MAKSYIARLACGHSAYVGDGKAVREGKKTSAFCPWCHRNQLIVGLEEAG